MSRTRLVLLVVVCGLLPTVPQAAPLPKEKPPELYYPTKKGTTWTMRTKTLIGGTIQDVRYEILDSKQTENEWLVTVGTSHDKEEACKPYQKFIVSGKGVFEVEVAGNRLNNPFALLLLPLKKDSEWVSAREFGREKWKFKVVMIGSERVETPSGEFNAVKLLTSNADLNEEDGVSWWVVDIGEVKREDRLQITEIVKLKR